MKDLIPQDLMARAKSRGLQLDFTRGHYLAKRGKFEQFAARDIAELRRWLASAESLPIRTV